MSPSGDSLAYVAGTTHRPIPLAKDLLYRKAHDPVPPKPTGLDWDALRPKCSGCQTPSGLLNDRDLCPTCDPAAATTTPDAADSTSPAMTGTGGRLAAVVSGEAPRQPARTRRGLRVVSKSTVDGRRAHIDRAKIVELYTAGQSMNQVAGQLGHVARTVRRVLEEEGVEIRPREKAERKPSGPSHYSVDRANFEATVVAQYRDGALISDLAAQYDCSRPRIRKILDRNGVQRVDERSFRSGGRPRDYDQAVVDAVRRLYVDEGKSRNDVATALGLPYKTVVTIMGRHNIPARQGQSGHADGAAPLKQQIAALGVSSHDIKVWALAQGLIYEICPGIPAARLVKAYAEAHPADHDQQEAS